MSRSPMRNGMSSAFAGCCPGAWPPSRSRWSLNLSMSAARRMIWRSTSGSLRCTTATRRSSTGCSSTTSRNSPRSSTPRRSAKHAASSATFNAARAACGSLPTTLTASPSCSVTPAGRASGGMGIPGGNPALYPAGAGVHPGMPLPISLDVGTDNEDLLRDPLYLGYPKPRLRGADYDALIEAFVSAVLEVYPAAVLQWEDFKQHTAIRLLGRYRQRIASFNDDIQGTAAVVVAGLLAALRLRGEPLAAQRLVFVGAGAAGTGIARLAETVIREQDPGASLRRAVMMLDSRGLIFDGRDQVDEDKRPFALPAPELAACGFAAASHYDLETVVRQMAPTILIGTSASPGAFTERVIREMAARTPAPIVLPLSNPTLKSEATPADVLAWSDGRALVATGSAFDPVRVEGRDRVIGQANNVFI